MDETIDVVFGDGAGNAVSSFDVYILEVKVLRGIVSADKIVDDVGMAYRLFD